MKNDRGVILGLVAISVSCFLLASQRYFNLSDTTLLISAICAYFILGNIFYSELRLGIFKLTKYCLESCHRGAKSLGSWLGTQIEKAVARKNEIVSFRNKNRIRNLIYKTQSKLNQYRVEAMSLRKENFQLRASQRRHEIELVQLREELEGIQTLWLQDQHSVDLSSKTIAAKPQERKTIWGRFRMARHSFTLSRSKNAHSEPEVSQEIW